MFGRKLRYSAGLRHFRLFGMRLTSKIGMAIGLLLFFTLSGVALSVWGGNRLSSLYQRSDHAHRSYQSYLSLSSYTYQLFKQLGDSLLLREQMMGQRERELLFHIKSELVSIDRLLQSQHAAGAAAEEAHIAREMAGLIETMAVDYQSVVRAINRSPNDSVWRQSARALDKRLDEQFEPLLAAALAKSKTRAKLAAAEESALTTHFQRLTLYFTLIFVFATAALVYWVQREIRLPLQRLLAGAEALEAGHIDHRVSTQGGGSEFTAVAGAFNQMASTIDQRQRGLHEVKSQLELAVEERTAALQQALQQVTDLDETRRQLLADVSHELRTPLTIVRGEADLALRGREKSTESYCDSLRVTKDAAEHMTRLVEDLLFVAKAESKQVTLQCENYNLVAQVQQLLPQLKHLGSQRGGSETFDFSYEGSEIWISADSDRIRQVILILVENAFRYGEAPWGIELVSQLESVVLRVRNRGKVLSERQMSLLFERFYRGSDSAVHYKKGTGLGLPVARAIIHAHGSELRVESNELEGTSMYFHLANVSTSVGAVS